MDWSGILSLVLMGIGIVSIGIALRWARPGFTRGLAVALLLGLMASLYLSPPLLLGRAKPLSLALLDGQGVAEAAILSATFTQDKGIFLTLLWGGEPGLYRMPWDIGTALQLTTVMAEARRTGATPVMRQPFTTAWNEELPRFYAQAPKVATELAVPEAPPKVAAPKSDRAI